MVLLFLSRVVLICPEASRPLSWWLKTDFVEGSIIGLKRSSNALGKWASHITSSNALSLCPYGVMVTRLLPIQISECSRQIQIEDSSITRSWPVDWFFLCDGLINSGLKINVTPNYQSFHVILYKITMNSCFFEFSFKFFF